jgi:hypothetical protein
MAGAERVPECAAPEKKRRCDNDERINEVCGENRAGEFSTE